MAPPRLSVCTPTYNRAGNLEGVVRNVAEIRDRGVSVEHVICDNASTDDTRTVAEALSREFDFVRYYRQPQNFGGIQNQTAAYRLALGDYVTYLADDDRLIPEGIIEILTHLDATPSIVAAVLPSVWWDYKNNVPVRTICTASQNVAIAQHSYDVLLQKFLREGFIPELMIARKNVASRVLLHRPQGGYFAYCWATDFLSFGDFGLYSCPAYKSTWIDANGQENSNTDGTSVARHHVESFQDGLEYCYLHALERGLIGANAQAAWREEIRKFMERRLLSVAIVCVRSSAYLKALNFLRRLATSVSLSGADILNHPEYAGNPILTDKVLNMLTSAAVAEFSVEMIRQTPNVEEIIVHSRSPHQNFFRELFPGTIRVLDIPDMSRAIEAAGKSGAFLFVDDESQREEAIGAAIPAGNIYCLSNLYRQLGMSGFVT